MTGYVRATKRPCHNCIDEVVKKMKNGNPVGNGRHNDDYILGFEIALRILANANGSFKERLYSI